MRSMTIITSVFVVRLASFAADTDFLKVFPPSPAIPDLSYSGRLSYTQTYAPSGSTWASGLKEQNVFFASLVHSESSDNSWEVRLGKGGQLYSLRGIFGESQAPQTANAQWMDQIFQWVATNTPLVNEGPAAHQYFIHQAGDYLRDPGFTSTFYSPMLANNFDASSNAVRVMVWGQQAQIPNPYKSGLLIYEQVRDLGSGVIELTHMVYNFGSDLINYASSPWGGVRQSALPVTLISNPDGTSKVDTSTFASAAALTLSASGGWIAWTRDRTNSSSPTLALVLGKDKPPPLPSYQYAQARMRYGTASASDFEVAELNPFINQTPGSAYFFRSYLIAGTLAKVQALANSLAPYAARGPMNFTEDTADLQPIFLQSTNGQTILTTSAPTGQQPAFYTFAQPVPNSSPLFVMRSTKTGQLRLSTDPYELLQQVPYGNQMVYKPYDGTVEYIGFMGYVLPAKSATSKALLYDNMLDLVADRAYFPSTTTNTNLKVVAGKMNITSVTVAGGGANIAPNAWIEIRGTNLTSPVVPATGVAWQRSDFVNDQMPTQVAGTSVTVNGKSAYVSYVSPTQVNALTPLDTSTGPVRVQLSAGSNQSAPFSVTEAAVAPSFFQLAPTYYVAAQHADGTGVGPASMSVPGYAFSPAKPGELIVIYGNGCGALPGLVAGSVTQSGRLLVAPAVQIGGISASVAFAGLTGPGLCQYNIVVPDGVSDGDNAVSTMIAGASTPSGDLIPVQR